LGDLVPALLIVGAIGVGMVVLAWYVMARTDRQG